MKIKYIGRFITLTLALSFLILPQQISAQSLTMELKKTCMDYVQEKFKKVCADQEKDKQYSCCVGLCKGAIDSKVCKVTLSKTDPDGTAYCHEACVQAIGGDIDITTSGNSIRNY
jgi:hypothetical protein